MKLLTTFSGKKGDGDGWQSRVQGTVSNFAIRDSPLITSRVNTRPRGGRFHDRVHGSVDISPESDFSEQTAAQRQGVWQSISDTSALRRLENSGLNELSKRTEQAERSEITELWSYSNQKDLY
jgi:hypothetical protein